jgi:hypothetical protein
LQFLFDVDRYPLFHQSLLEECLIASGIHLSVNSRILCFYGGSVSLYDRIDLRVALGGVECTNEGCHFVFFSLAIGFYGQSGSQRPRPDFHAFERLLGLPAQQIVFLAFDDFPLEKP